MDKGEPFRFRVERIDFVDPGPVRERITSMGIVVQDGQLKTAPMTIYVRLLLLLVNWLRSVQSSKMVSAVSPGGKANTLL